MGTCTFSRTASSSSRLGVRPPTERSAHSSMRFAPPRSAATAFSTPSTLISSRSFRVIGSRVAEEVIHEECCKRKRVLSEREAEKVKGDSSTTRADRFAGANRQGDNRPAPLGMTRGDFLSWTCGPHARRAPAQRNASCRFACQARIPFREKRRRCFSHGEAVIGLGPEELRIVPGFASKSVRVPKNFCKEARHENSFRSHSSSSDSCDRISVVVPGAVPPDRRTLRFRGLQYQLAVLAGSGGRLGRFRKATGG